MVYPDLCLEFLTGNQSFCRKNKQKCHSVRAGLGDFTLGEDSLAFLAKARESSGGAFNEPIILGDKLKGDLQEALLSKKMTISDWSRMCAQVKLMEPPVSCDDIAEQQAYSKKAKGYLQTPKKPKLFTARSRFINTIDFQNGEDSLFTPFQATAEQSFIAEKSFAESKQTAF